METTSALSFRNLTFTFSPVNISDVLKLSKCAQEFSLFVTRLWKWRRFSSEFEKDAKTTDRHPWR